MRASLWGLGRSSAGLQSAPKAFSCLFPTVALAALNVFHWCCCLQSSLQRQSLENDVKQIRRLSSIGLLNKRAEIKTV